MIALQTAVEPQTSTSSVNGIQDPVTEEKAPTPEGLTAAPTPTPTPEPTKRTSTKKRKRKEDPRPVSDDDEDDSSDGGSNEESFDGVSPGRIGGKGRWTSEEHALFVQGLSLYGRDWRKVANNIKTRTNAQIRSHAQKYFSKLSGKNKKRFTDVIRGVTDQVPSRHHTRKQQQYPLIQDLNVMEMRHKPQQLQHQHFQQQLQAQQLQAQQLQVQQMQQQQLQQQQLQQLEADSMLWQLMIRKKDVEAFMTAGPGIGSGYQPPLPLNNMNMINNPNLMMNGPNMMMYVNANMGVPPSSPSFYNNETVVAKNFQLDELAAVKFLTNQKNN
ncbi:hypothetical protein ScalyP_jg11962 [Parmales sp. scaly parma]|nr:hypothetical protein ScalyP_jg11962 [Parmales sp. scaly parma]